MRKRVIQSVTKFSGSIPGVNGVIALSNLCCDARVVKGGRRVRPWSDLRGNLVSFCVVPAPRRPSESVVSAT